MAIRWFTGVMTTDADHPPATELARCRATLDRTDWAAYQRHSRRHVAARASAVNWGLLILIGAAAVLIGMSLVIKDGSSGSEVVAPAGPTFGVGEVVLLTGGVLLLATFVGAVFLSAWFRRAWYRALAGRVELTADVDGATVRRTGQETRFTWASVLAWSEDADRLYVSIAPNVGWPLPKGDFRSHEEVDRIRMVLADSGAPKR